MYDASGEEYKKKGGFDVLDYALISNGTLFQDDRIKYVDPEHYEYPYTVEYTYEISWSEVIIYPNWYPIDDYNIAVENSKFSLNISKDAGCRFYEQNITDKASIQNSDDNTTYTWQLNNATALTEENFSPSLYDFAPVVFIAPSKLKVEGYEGNFETWTGLGRWIYQLNLGRNNLGDETRVKILKIASQYPDDKAKIKALYEFMQNKTRYVSVQIGIGGFQPFDAETVDRLSYGDCKALSNYMKSILEVAGIKSNYTLVRAGDDNLYIREDFPSNQFNHAILCVPLATDTVWLECTDQNGPFNYMGTFTAGRKVLVIDEEGGKLIYSPALKAESNLKSGKVEVSLDANGDGFATISKSFYGAAYDAYRRILRSDQVDRKKLVTSSIHIPNFELDNFNIQETKSEKPFVTERLNLTITNYCTRVGEKLMLCLNMMNKLSESPFQATTRKNIVSIKWPVYEVDTVAYELPQGYTLVKIPEKVSLQSDFGQYTTEVIKSGSTIQYVRTFKVYKAEHPVNRYDEIVTFFDKIVTADENKVMLTRVM
jgi:transglutaminase-like putative cysteine protease